MPFNVCHYNYQTFVYLLITSEPLVTAQQFSWLLTTKQQLKWIYCILDFQASRIFKLLQVNGYSKIMNNC